MKKLLMFFIFGILLFGMINFVSASWNDTLNVDLAAYYPLSNNSDVTGQGHNLSNRTGNYAAGKIGNALSNDYIYGDGARFNSISVKTNDNFSWCFWAEKSGAGTQWIGGVGAEVSSVDSAGNPGWDSEHYTGGTIWGGHIRDWALSAEQLDSSPSGWEFLCWTKNYTGLTMWRNGTYITTTALSGSYGSDTNFAIIGASDITAGELWQGKIDEFGIWNRTLTPHETQVQLWNSGSGITWIETGGTSPSAITVTLSYPSNSSSISTTSINLMSNYSITDVNLVNATYYIWHSNNSIYNRTVNSSVSSILNASILDISGLIFENYKWNVHVCGTNTTGTVCSWGSTGNFTLKVEGQIVNESYNNITYETSSEKFQANFSLFPGTNVISAYLVYNGTSYVISDITNYGSIVELKKTIDISLNSNPVVNETKQFFWSFIFSNGGLTSQNTSLTNQTVLSVNIFHCNDTYSKLGLNFTVYDETNPNPLINSTFHTFWSYWLGSGTIKKNYSYEDTSLGNSSFKFCINPNQSVIFTDLDSEITSTGFFSRTYYLRNATVNNATQEIKLRMINESLGVKFFHTIRRSVTRIANAIVIISKFDVGIGEWVTVGIRESDDDGVFVEYLELDKEYAYSITKNGVFLGSIEKTSVCTAAPCKIDLDLSETSTDLWNGYYDVFAPNVVYNLTYDKNTKNVTFTFVDTSGLAQYFRLQVNLLASNETGKMICNKTLYATIGTLKCDLTGETGQFIARTYVSRSPEHFVAFLYGILDALAEIIGKNEGLFFALLIVVVVGLVGAWNPAVGVILAGLAFVLASIMGLIMISMTSIVLVVLLIIILVIKMGKSGV